VLVAAAATATPRPALCRMVSSGGRAMGCRGEALTARKRSLHKCALASLRGGTWQASGGTGHRPGAPPATFYLALTRLTDGGWAEWRTYDLLRKSVLSKVSGRRTYDLLRKSVLSKVSSRRALMFLGKPRNARQGTVPAPKILGIRFCAPASIETRFRERLGQQRQAPTSRNSGPLKNGGLRRGWDGGSCRDGLWRPT
jgi:hypothetical protein